MTTMVFNARLSSAEEATLLDAAIPDEAAVPLFLVRIRLVRGKQEKEIRSRLDLDKRWFIDQVEGDDEATILLRAWTSEICDAVRRRWSERGTATQPPNCS